MRSAEIKRRFLAHWEKNGHTIVPPIPLPAYGDPNLLFVTAGMVQFVPFFTGQQKPPWRRVASVQKCVRTPDIDEVGKTSRHLTFFQMNGNFSFGDYFKAEAIPLSWELMTKPVAEEGFGIDPDRLWVTVYADDEEAVSIWRGIGLAPERIVRLGKATNFWSMGIPGPCGPCSEIFVDRGAEYGQDGGPAVDEDRYMEVWNNVFMQYERGPGTTKEDYEILGELPTRNIDTGMGLERMATFLQGVDNLYEIDEVRPVLDRAAEITGKRYGVSTSRVASQSHPDDVRLRVIADHVRTAMMLISEGVTPSNEGRGYVLRRLLRRAIRSVRLLGFGEPALPHLLPVARDCMAPSYPEVSTDYDRISSYAFSEEESFLGTLRQGTTILDLAISGAKAARARKLTGEQAFQLHDTYGFPIDLTLEIAAEQGLGIDVDEFQRLMSQQRARAKADAASKKSSHADLTLYRSVLEEHGTPEFTGYQELRRQARVWAILVADGPVAVAREGDEVEVILDATPFYAEAGGQQPDIGRLTFDSGELDVHDVQRPVPGLIVHRGRVAAGEIRAGGEGYAAVDPVRRQAISRSHTATHLIHQTIRAFLGESATQAGSLNSPGRLRFDFSTPSAVPASVLADVEQQVNEVLLRDLEVRAFVTSQEEARKLGAIALFGEKYGSEVRVVEVGDYARELCGGTHVGRSSQLGLVKILSESSIGAGVRRVEALVGLDAFRFLAQEHLLVSRLAHVYQAPADQLVGRAEQTIAELRNATRELAKLRSQAVLASAGAIAEAAKDVRGVAVVLAEAPERTSSNDVRAFVQDIRARFPADRPAVVAVACRTDGKASLVVGANRPAQERGLAASRLVRETLSGRGGGGDDLAQGGGLPADGVPSVLAAIERLVEETADGAGAPR